MEAKKWWRLTPRQIARLDGDRTIGLFPLGTMGSADETTRVWDDLREVEDDAKGVAEVIDEADLGPLAEFGAILLLSLGLGPEPGPDNLGTLALDRTTYESLLVSVCSSVKKQGIRYLVMVVRDPDVEAAARSVQERLNKAGPEPWVVVYNRLEKPPTTSFGGDICRRICQVLGCNPANCPQ